LYEGESLVRPGRKQATANKFGIYSTYSPRSSIHFLARCLTFSSHSKKIQKFVRPTRSSREFWLLRRTKNGDIAIVFSVQGTGGSPTGTDPENRVGDQDTGIPGRLVSSRLQVPRWAEALSCKNKTSLVTSRGGFPSKCPSIAPAEMSNTPRWYFGPLEDNQWGGCRLDLKKSRREYFQRIFALRIFWGGVSRYAATPLIVALSPGHSYIPRFRPWSPIATGNHLDRAEKIPSVAQRTGTVNVFDPRSGISGPTSRRASACPDLHERWTQTAHVRCPFAQLLI